jgi:hypothetical protein
LGEYEIGLYCETEEISNELMGYNEKYSLDKRKL